MEKINPTSNRWHLTHGPNSWPHCGAMYRN